MKRSFYIGYEYMTYEGIHGFNKGVHHTNSKLPDINGFEQCVQEENNYKSVVVLYCIRTVVNNG